MQEPTGEVARTCGVGNIDGRRSDRGKLEIDYSKILRRH